PSGRRVILASLLLVVALGRGRLPRITRVVVIRLWISLRVIETLARGGIALVGHAAVGRIDVAVVGLHLRRGAAAGQQLRLRRQLDGFADGTVLLVLLVLLIVWLGPRDSGIAARVAGQRNLRRAGQRYRGVEHALLLHQRIQRRGIGFRQSHAAVGSGGAEPGLGVGAMDGVADLGE